MTTLRFGSIKQARLIFEADEITYEPTDEGVTLHAKGAITLQDPVAVEEMIAGDYECFLTATKEGEDVLHGKFRMMLLALEPAQLVARLVPA